MQSSTGKATEALLRSKLRAAAAEAAAGAAAVSRLLRRLMYRAHFGRFGDFWFLVNFWLMRGILH